jgi:ABC-type sulfate transport system, permease component
MANHRSKHLLPGFGLTMGVSLFYITLVILLPIAAMLLKVAGMGWPEFWRIVSSNRALAAYRITFGSAFIATVLNGVIGLLLAWVITRYRFPGRRVLDALVDLPFALPTAVAGLVLVTLFASGGWYGQFLEPAGIKVNYTQLGIVAAMTFTSIPLRGPRRPARARGSGRGPRIRRPHPVPLSSIGSPASGFLNR